MTEAERMRLHRARDPERARRKAAEYYEQNRERIRARQRAHYEANRERILAKNTAYLQAHPDRRNEASRRHYAKDLAYSRARAQTAENKRRALSQGGDLTAREWLEVLEEFGHRCAYCQTTGRLSQDHMMPLSRGGRHTKDNVVPACKSCNSSKNAKTLLEFATVVPIKMRPTARV